MGLGFGYAIMLYKYYMLENCFNSKIYELSYYLHLVNIDSSIQFCISTKYLRLNSIKKGTIHVTSIVYILFNYS